MGRKKKQQVKEQLPDTEEKALIQEIKHEKKMSIIRQKESEITLPGKATSQLPQSLRSINEKRSRKYSKQSHSKQTAEQKLANLPFMTWQEVGKHDHKDDTWIVIDNVVYNVTKYKEKHPGGIDVIMQRAGKNATKAFAKANHPTDVIESKLPRHMVGRISPDSLIEGWQKQEQTGLFDLYCAIFLGVTLASSLVFLAL